eukprot:GHVQ01015889.1.p1 GENE.GHVQ01015889.1~~GHVQ01015889.1.p1  ORF type:complete len:320 (-),score=42.35 GHVQ01015889.1:382-1341(-)
MNVILSPSAYSTTETGIQPGSKSINSPTSCPSICMYDVVGICLDASQAILDIYYNTTTGEGENGVKSNVGSNGGWLAEHGGVSLKTDRETGTVSPLTVADTKANKIICEGLKRIAPDVPIISEENEVDGYDSIRRSYTFYWLVDPLDGTKEFIKRSGDFTVNVALCYMDRPIAGVVIIPVSRTVYYSAEGHGAYKCVLTEGLMAKAVSQSVQGGREEWLCEMVRECSESIGVKEFKLSDKGLVCVASLSHQSNSTVDYLDRFINPSLLSMGSSIKLMLVAEGTAHVYPRLAPTCKNNTLAHKLYSPYKPHFFFTRQIPH